MDPLRLLSRGTKISRQHVQRKPQRLPSNGQGPQSTPYAPASRPSAPPAQSRKRKRGQEDLCDLGIEGAIADNLDRVEDDHGFADSPSQHGDGANSTRDDPQQPPSTAAVAKEQRRKILKEHKLKITWLNIPSRTKKGARRGKSESKKEHKDKHLLFPNPLQSFDLLGARYGVSPRLVRNVLEQGFTIPTEVQLAALPLLLENPTVYLAEDDPGAVVDESIKAVDLLTVAPTGSGKTLSFLLPLLHTLRQDKRGEASAERGVRSLVLAPTRELAGQTVNEGRKLTKNTGISITQMRKGMRFVPMNEAVTNNEGEGNEHDSVVKADIVVSTPGVLQSAIYDPLNKETLANVRHLVLDEADVLLDPPVSNPDTRDLEHPY